MTETHRCRDCGEVKPVAEFYRQGDGPDSYCKPCREVRSKASRDKYRPVINERERARYAADRGGRRSRQLANKKLLKYGLTPEGYEALLAAQGHVCPICTLPFEGLDGVGLHNAANWMTASVDHDHDTGAIRGILHRRCNLAIEYLMSDADLARARAYLARGADDARLVA